MTLGEAIAGRAISSLVAGAWRRIKSRLKRDRTKPLWKHLRDGPSPLEKTATSVPNANFIQQAQQWHWHAIELLCTANAGRVEIEIYKSAAPKSEVDTVDAYALKGHRVLHIEGPKARNALEERVRVFGLVIERF